MMRGMIRYTLRGERQRLVRGVRYYTVLSSLWLHWWTGYMHWSGCRRTAVVSHEVLMWVEEDWSGRLVVGVVVYRRGGNEWTLLE